MTAPTYSLNTKGMGASKTQVTYQELTIPDVDVEGNAIGTTGGQQYCMQRGDVFLCKHADGSQHWYRFDAERSTPGHPILIFVGP